MPISGMSGISPGMHDNFVVLSPLRSEPSLRAARNQLPVEKRPLLPSAARRPRNIAPDCRSAAPAQRRGAARSTVWSASAAPAVVHRVVPVMMPFSMRYREGTREHQGAGKGEGRKLHDQISETVGLAGCDVRTSARLSWVLGASSSRAVRRGVSSPRRTHDNSTMGCLVPGRRRGLGRSPGLARNALIPQR
jgi:hypothetical protein